ncbi:MAG: M1 family metallopeptidase [Flavobacteriales bacterium]
MKICCFLITCFWTVSFFGQANYDVLHYDLHLLLNPPQRQITVNETLQIRLTDRTSQIKLDLVGPAQNKMGLSVSGVTAPYQNVKWRQTSEQLIIDLPQQLQQGDIQLFVQMSGQPQDGLIIGKNKFNEPTIFADNWPNRAHFWYACHDHPLDKATYQFVVQAPMNFVVVANGNLVSKIPRDQNRSIEWSYQITEPIATKVAVIGVADLNSKEIGKLDSIPIFATVYPQDSVKGMASFKVAPEILEFYQKTVGPYPFTQLNNVQSTTRYGGMENAGCIFYDENSLNNDLRSAHLIAHEIAHQWFGNAVTESDWPHLWLSEGLATFMTNLYIQETEGDLAFKAQLTQDRNKVLRFHQQFKRPLVDSLTTDLNALLNPNAYQKGAWVLHMLRIQMGDAAFFAGLQAYYAKYRHQNASTEDFCAVMLAQVKGDFKPDLRAFFDQWLYQVGHPLIAVKFRENAGQVFFDVEQVQEAFFSFPLMVSFYQNGQLVAQMNLIINDRNTSFLLPELKSMKNCTYVLDPKVQLLFEEMR